MSYLSVKPSGSNCTPAGRSAVASAAGASRKGTDLLFTMVQRAAGAARGDTWVAEPAKEERAATAAVGTKANMVEKVPVGEGGAEWGTGVDRAGLEPVYSGFAVEMGRRWKGKGAVEGCARAAWNGAKFA